MGSAFSVLSSGFTKEIGPVCQIPIGIIPSRAQIAIPSETPRAAGNRGTRLRHRGLMSGPLRIAALSGEAWFFEFRAPSRLTLIRRKSLAARLPEWCAVCHPLGQDQNVLREARGAASPPDS